jgi:hypothetical protein
MTQIVQERLPPVLFALTAQAMVELPECVDESAESQLAAALSTPASHMHSPSVVTVSVPFVPPAATEILAGEIV